MESQQQNPPNGMGNEGQTLGQRLDHVSGSAQHAWTRTRDAFSEIKDTVDLDGRAKRHPYGTLAAALGIGYVLGGGLFSPLTARILGLGLRIGMRLAVLPMITDELSSLAESLGGEGGEEIGKRRKAKRT
jgi:hypothetical protein